MESTWRSAGVQLGKHWKLVLLGAVALTAALFYGLTQLQFATGQDSYLNSDSQIALDNVAFQDQFGGETAILLFSAEEGKDVTDLFTGDNLAELERFTEELRQIPEVESVITPLVSMIFSDALLKGPGRNALLQASGRDPDPDGTATRQADVSMSLARLGEIPGDEQVLSNPAWIELL
ncbi:MAG: RND transporter, partial [Acidimicrobiales bacterium]|nr:RND transporter [Acidimicrobiales bacterium]